MLMRSVGFSITQAKFDSTLDRSFQIANGVNLLVRADHRRVHGTVEVNSPEVSASLLVGRSKRVLQVVERLVNDEVDRHTEGLGGHLERAPCEPELSFSPPSEGLMLIWLVEPVRSLYQLMNATSA